MKDASSYLYNDPSLYENNEPFSSRSNKFYARIKDECEKVIFKNSFVLEVGCGNGRNLFEFEKLGANVFGTDLSEYAIDLANTYKTKYNSSAKFYLGDMTKVNFEKNFFDIILLLSNTITEISYTYFNDLCIYVKSILKSSGVFCLEVKDSVVHFNEKGLTIEKYCTNDAVITDTITIPGRNNYIYKCHFWTLGMIKFILSLYFKNIQIKSITDKRYWLVCSDV